MHAADDSLILERAAEEERVVVSADSDFAMLLAILRRNTPSFILFREPEIVRAEDYASRIVACLPVLHRELLSGCVVVFRRGRIRVRSLPFKDAER
jgi:predicted nuclease of predicted toxin-antitoxin system